MAESIRDYTSIYGVKDFIRNDIAPNYFEDIDDISMMNVGLLGLTTDVTATSIFDAMQVVSRYVTETIPGKATLPEFIYAHANNYGITDLFASCAKVRAVLVINQSDVINKGTVNGNYIDYVFGDDMVVYIEDIPFMLPYKIRIRSSLYNGVYNHKCTYYDDGYNNSIFTLTHPFIKCVRLRITGESSTYLALTVTLCQYSKTTLIENIITNNKLNIPYVDVSHTESLCNFEILYRAPGSTTNVQLLKYLETTPATSTPFAYYKLVDENTFRISFSNDDRYFIPEYNSELEIHTYETLGEKGNFQQYKGDDIYVSTSDNTAMNCVIIGDSTGGASQADLDTINRRTWSAQRTINSITTESDLNTYFTMNYASEYDTSAYFIKVRDDFVDRVYACYMRLKDSTDIFPTNTLNASIYIPTTENPNSNFITASNIHYIIKAGSRFVYSDTTTKTECKLISDTATAPEDGIEYSNIGLISISKNPNSIAYYMNSVDKSVNMLYHYLNDESVYQFILKDFHILRDAVLGEDTYKITVTIYQSDDTVSNAGISEDSIIESSSSSSSDIENEFDPTKLHIYLYFPETATDGHYKQLTYQSASSNSDTGYVFTCEIQTTDNISDDVIELKGVVPTDDDSSEYISINMTNPNMELLLFYTEDGTVGNHDYTQIPNTANYVLTNVFIAEDDEMYFAYPLSMIRSTVSFKEINPGTSSDGWYMYVKSMPLFARSFIKDSDHLKDALTRINSDHSALVDAMDNITSNFAINLRFYNTYGRSRIFTISDGNNSTLNQTNCTISIDVKYKSTTDIADTSSYMKKTIKSYIESMSESTENSDSNVNMINVSTLLTKLHQEYSDDVDYFVFKSINGYGPLIQSINMELDLSAVENYDVIPEFLNISLDNITLTEI